MRPDVGRVEGSAMSATITKHFRYSEFAQQARHGFDYVAYPMEWVEPRLVPLCELLEKIRRAAGDRPVHILSGYRSPPYNRAIGGATKSQHMAGRAADIVIDGVRPAYVHGLILELQLEGTRIGGLGRYPGFVHVDIRPGRLARWQGARLES